MATNVTTPPTAATPPGSLAHTAWLKGWAAVGGPAALMLAAGVPIGEPECADADEDERPAIDETRP